MELETPFRRAGVNLFTETHEAHSERRQLVQQHNEVPKVARQLREDANQAMTAPN
jgi:hypothetical protein